jgi:hypothetical protein
VSDDSDIAFEEELAKQKRQEHHKHKYQKYKNYPRRVLSSIYNGAKRRSKKKGFGFNISKRDIEDLYVKQHGKCAITGINMTFIANDKYKISLDRIDSKKGYLKNNVQLLCWWVNRCKSNYSKSDLLVFAHGILRSMS